MTDRPWWRGRCRVWWRNEVVFCLWRQWRWRQPVWRAGTVWRHHCCSGRRGVAVSSRPGFASRWCLAFRIRTIRTEHACTRQTFVPYSVHTDSDWQASQHQPSVALCRVEWHALVRQAMWTPSLNAASKRHFLTVSLITATVCYISLVTKRATSESTGRITAPCT